jgi:glucose-1-phosphate adenylyltransferase
MAPPRILLVILAGGAGGRLELLTRDRAKPAVPYAGMFRLIDFPLSNAANSGLSDVWVVQQFNPVSLSGHLSSGRPWDLDRTQGGLLTLQPHPGDDRGGWHAGTADALWRNGPLLREFDPDALVVVSADAVYRLDYEDLVRSHREAGAVATMVTTRVDPEDAGRYGVVRAEGGQVRDYAYKPDEPAGDLVSNEVFVFDPGPVLDLLDELAAQEPEDGLADLGTALLPRLVAGGGVREHRFEDYWRDVGTVDAYWQSHQDLLADPPLFALHDKRWPLSTQGGDNSPARVAAGATITNCLLSPECYVGGSVERSVLSPGVLVEAGASVVDSILLPGAVIRSGARVVRSVLDDGVEVSRGALVGGPEAVSLLGRRVCVEAEATIKAGARFPEGD